jgi:hypothetical protein
MRSARLLVVAGGHRPVRNASVQRGDSRGRMDHRRDRRCGDLRLFRLTGDRRPCPNRGDRSLALADPAVRLRDPDQPLGLPTDPRRGRTPGVPYPTLSRDHDTTNSPLSPRSSLTTSTGRLLCVVRRGYELGGACVVLTPRRDGVRLGRSGCRHADEFDCGLRPGTWGGDPPTSSASAVSETTSDRRRMVLARFGRS